MRKNDARGVDRGGSQLETFGVKGDRCVREVAGQREGKGKPHGENLLSNVSYQWSTP